MLSFVLVMFHPRQSSAAPDAPPPVKRAVSLLSVPMTDLLNIDYDPSRNGHLTAPRSPLKAFPPPRRAQAMARSSTETTKLSSGVDFERTSNVSPGIITMPNLLECATRLQRRPSSILESETPGDATFLRSFPRHERRARLKNGGQARQSKRCFSDRIPEYILQQPLIPMEMFTRERPITATLETNYSTDPIGRINQLLKKHLV